MESSKRILLSTIGIAVMIVVLSGITFAFFNYTRIGASNVVRVGRIYFNTSQNGRINLENVVPITSEELANDVGNHGSVTISITGDTTYDGGIEYLVTLTDVNDRINGKRIPVRFNIEGSNIGTSSNDYWTERGGNSSVYELYDDGIVKEEKYLLVGYITSGATGINGSIEITAFIDKDRIVVSDTYDGLESDNNGTTNSFVNGRTVFTTEEWNSFQGAGNELSFKVKVEANEGVWVRNLSDDTPSQCFTPGELEGHYVYNSNRTTEDINDCATYFENEGWSVDTDNGESLQSFCDGTGTMWGDTFAQSLEYEYFSSSMLEYFEEHNIITNSGYTVNINDYDENCGRNVVIPETINVAKKTYTQNRNMTEEEIEDCVNYIGGELEWSVNTNNGETMEKFCDGTGTAWGETLEYCVNNGRFSQDNLDTLEEGNVLISTSTSIPATVVGIGYEAFIDKGIQSVTLPNSVEGIGSYAFRDNEIDEVIIPDSVLDDMCQSHVFDLSVQITQNNNSFKCGCFVTQIENNEIEIIDYDDSCPKDVVIPSQIGGKRVTSIGNGAFSYCNITSVEIPNSVKRIGNSAFYHNNLTNVTIPNSITRIEDWVFSYNSLTSVTIPDSVTSIGYTAFYNNLITELVIPNSVTSINDSAFAHNKISNLSIGSGLTSLPSHSFEHNELTSVEIPNNISTLGYSAFADNKITTLVIGVSEISQNAFKNNRISNLSLGDHVTTIGANAFENNLLTSVIIPDNVTRIDSQAFHDNVITSLTIGSGIIGNNVGSGYGHMDLNAFDLENVTYIDKVSIDGLFSCGRGYCNASRLRGNLTLGEHVTTIEGGAFLGQDITGISLPDGLTTIGADAFRDCKLTSVTIPSSVTRIGMGAFYNNELTSVSILGETDVRDNSFRDNPNIMTLYINKERIYSSFAEDVGFTNITNLTLGNNVKVVGNNSFQDCQIENLTLGNSIESIGSAAFYDNKISQVNFPDTLQRIDAGAFYNNLLTSVDIPNSVTSIGRNVFASNNLLSVTIGNGITSIDYSAFLKDSSSNQNLSSISINKSCSDIKAMNYYPWIGDNYRAGTTIYGSNNEVCDSW